MSERWTRQGPIFDDIEDTKAFLALLKKLDSEKISRLIKYMLIIDRECFFRDIVSREMNTSRRAEKWEE